MKLFETLIPLSLLCFVIWFNWIRKTKPGIELMIEGAFFKSSKILIRYNAVIKIEKDMAFSLSPLGSQPSFVITYFRSDGSTNAIRYNLFGIDIENWQEFKKRVLSENPSVFFDKGVL